MCECEGHPRRHVILVSLQSCLRCGWRGMGCTVLHPVQGSFHLSPKSMVSFRCGCCVSFDAERKVCLMLAGRTIVHTRGIGGMQVINLHPYKHTTATLLVHSHWVMSPMKQRSVWNWGWEATSHTVLSIQSRSGLAAVCWGGTTAAHSATVYDVSGLVTRLKRIFGLATLGRNLPFAQRSSSQSRLVQRRP